MRKISAVIEGLGKNWQEDGHFRKAILLFLAVKLALILVAAGAQLIPHEFTNRQDRDANVLVNGWAQYDAAAYADIAKNGYNAEFAEGRGNYGWFPLYPLLIAVFSFMGYYMAGFLISNILSLGAVILVYFLVKEQFDSGIAYKTVLLMSLFPTAYFFNAVYTESLFLLETAAFFWLMRKEKYAAAGIVGFLAAMTRTQGLLLGFPALYLWYKKSGIKISAAAIPLVLIPMGFGVFLFYHFLVTGDPFIQFSTHAGFQREVTLPFSAITHAISGLASSVSLQDVQGAFYQAFNLFVLAFFAALTYYSYRLLGKEYFIYLFVSVMLPLFSARLEAISRFYLVLFPAFAVLAVMSRNGKKGIYVKALYAAFAVLLVLFTIRHANEDIFLSAIF